ncbi:MAG: hypothetical protein L3K17_03420 [Thermoplasmata archaeon]|nr:hypothetical protein [Thermoplasmata archaeon]
MNAGTLRTALLAPILAYALVMTALAPIPRTLLVLLGIGGAVVSLLATPSPQRLWWPYVPWLVVAAASVGLFALGHLANQPTAQGLAVGVLLGAPLVLLSWLVMWRDSLPATIVNGPMSLGIAGFSLAVLRTLSANATGTGPAAWWGAIVQTALAQWFALTGGTPAPQAPLAYLGDSVYDILGFAAMMGLLVSMLLSSERLLRGPSTSRHAPSRVEPVSDLPAFAARGLPSSAYLLSGIASMAAAVAAVSLYEWSSASPGAPTFLGVAVGVLLGVGLLLGYAYRPPAESWEEAARARPPAHLVPVPRPTRVRRTTGDDPLFGKRRDPTA